MRLFERNPLRNGTAHGFPENPCTLDPQVVHQTQCIVRKHLNGVWIVRNVAATDAAVIESEYAIRFGEFRKHRTPGLPVRARVATDQYEPVTFPLDRVVEIDVTDFRYGHERAFRFTSRWILD